MTPAASSSALTRAHIEDWDVEHLECAATHWASTARQWEQHFSAIHDGTLRPGGTVWEGPAADSAADRTFADLVKVRAAAEALHSAAACARTAATDLAWAHRQALEVINEAETAGFAVAQDLSVSDTTLTVLMRGSEGRQRRAQEFAAEIASRAQILTQMDREAAGKITTALAPLRELRFDEAADALLGFRATPPTGIVWCRDHPGGGYMCRELLPNGTISIFASPTDISGHWPD